jgi:bZIP factor
MAEQDDEFDVVVGDTFVILSRARGWWVVQRDSDGSGKVIEAPIPPAGGDGSEVIQGWVPAGCLLETNVPVATAIAEAEAASGGKSKGSSSANGNGGNEMPDTPRDVTGFDDVALGENGSSFSGSSTKGKTPILPLSIVSTSFPGVALMEYRRKVRKIFLFFFFCGRGC